MNIENVKALAEILSSCGLTALEVDEGGSRIRLEKTAPSGQPLPRSAEVTSFASAETAASGASPDTQPEGSLNFNLLTEIRSPLVGVFYSAPSPDSETYVSIGSKVKKGDVLCVIETMKLMNEILAERDGEIVDICLKNGDIAEFEQVLFKMF